MLKILSIALVLPSGLCSNLSAIRLEAKQASSHLVAKSRQTRATKTLPDTFEQECYEDDAGCSFEEFREFPTDRIPPATYYFPAQMDCVDNACESTKIHQMYANIADHADHNPPTQEVINARDPNQGSDLVDFWTWYKYPCMYKLCVYAGTVSCVKTRVCHGDQCHSVHKPMATCHCRTQSNYNSTLSDQIAVWEGERCELDVNECAKSTTHTCHKTNEICVNKIPSVEFPKGFDCQCAAGYRYDSDKSECENINECAEGLSNCLNDGHMTCVDTDGSFDCRCPAGFLVVEVNGSKACQDIDECQVNNDCPTETHTCVNSVGSYECACKSGYNFTGSYVRLEGTVSNIQECEDIDECLDASNECTLLDHSLCQNTPGDYECVCQEGFKLADDFSNCLDINECERSPCRLDSLCENTEGSFICHCGEGFEELEDGSCLALTLCAEGGAGCGEHQVCLGSSFDAPEKYCQCSTGFRMQVNETSSTYICVNIDECAEGLSNCLADEYMTCVDTLGSFDCRCPSGFDVVNYGDSKTCQDIDECQVNDICPSDSHTCVNSPGSYECVCQSGYRFLDAYLSLNDTLTSIQMCEDIDECLESNPCDDHATCQNSQGGYACACLSGFDKVGNSTDCTDINECEHNPCSSDANCMNTAGSFSCQCHVGFFDLGQGQCVALNVCADGGFGCSEHQVCLSQVFDAPEKYCQCAAGYKMQVIETGYICVDIDECQLPETTEYCHNQHAGSVCENTSGSFNCVCSPGFSLQNGSCEDINECETVAILTCGDHRDCENTQGSYRCTDCIDE